MILQQEFLEFLSSPTKEMGKKTARYNPLFRQRAGLNPGGKGQSASRSSRLRRYVAIVHDQRRHTIAQSDSRGEFAARRRPRQIVRVPRSPNLHSSPGFILLVLP